MTIEAPEPFTDLPLQELQGRMLRDVTIDDMGFDKIADRVFSEDAEFDTGLGFSVPMAQILDRANLQSRDSLRAYLERGVQLATGLRHGAVIRAADAASWIANCFLADPARLHWHLKRLDGVSPSSAGAYIAESRGARSAWITGRELDLTRLMRRLPSRPTWNTFRGTHLEDLNRRILYARYRSSLTQDTAALEAIRSVHGTAKLPWLVGNPDDLAMVRHADGSRARYLVDEKCPSEPKSESAPIILDYQVQLHMYGLLAREAQHPVAALALSHLYVAPEIAKLWAQLLDADPLYIEEIEGQASMLLARNSDCLQHTFQALSIDEALNKEIIEVCSEADARVMRGEAAPWPKRRVAELDELRRSRAAPLEAFLARALPMADLLKTKVDETKVELRAILDGVDLANSKSPFPTLSLRQVHKLDQARVVEYLRANGVDVRELETIEEKRSFDNDVLRMKLTELGAPIAEFEDVSVQVGLANAKKGAVAERRALLERAAADSLDRVLAVPRAPAVASRAPDVAMMEP